MRWKRSPQRLLSLMCLLVFVYPVAIAEEAGPRGFSVLNVEVKQGGALAFEQAARRFKAASDKLNTPTYFASSPGIGQDRMYTFANPFNSFTELSEQRNVLVEAFGEEEAQKVFAMLQESVESVESFIAIPRPDMSIYGPDRETPPEITLVITLTAKAGMIDEFEDYSDKIIESTKAVAPDLYWNMYQFGLGGAARTYSVRINQDWADMDRPSKSIRERLVEHYGKRQGERIFAEGQASIESVSTAVRRIRADLSHMHTE